SAVPGTSITYGSLVNPQSPVYSTWAEGPFDMSAATGISGTLGSIELQANISNAPRITNQPVSLTVTQGSSPSLSDGASGPGSLGFQWLKNGSGLADGTNIIGSSSNVLSLNAVMLGDAGGYAVIITNDYGSVTSSVATLTVLAPPSITAQPQG